MLVKLVGEDGAHLLEISLAPTALGMTGIAPAEQQHLAHACRLPSRLNMNFTTH